MTWISHLVFWIVPDVHLSTICYESATNPIHYWPTVIPKWRSQQSWRVREFRYCNRVEVPSQVSSSFSSASYGVHICATSHLETLVDQRLLCQPPQKSNSGVAARRICRTLVNHWKLDYLWIHIIRDWCFLSKVSWFRRQRPHSQSAGITHLPESPEPIFGTPDS